MLKRLLMSFTSLLRARSLAGYAARSAIVTVALTAVAVVFAQRLSSEAAQVRALRIEAHRTRLVADAVVDIRMTLQEHESLLEALSGIVPDVTEGAAVREEVRLAATGPFGAAPEVIIEGVEPLRGGDARIQVVSFSVKGEATPEGASLFLERLARLPFLLRVTGISIDFTEGSGAPGTATLAGEFFVRVDEEL